MTPLSPANAAPATGIACGSILTSSVRLRHDVMCPAGTTIMVQSSDPITIDLAGRRLTSRVINGDVGLVTLKNGAVDGEIGFTPLSGGSVALSKVTVRGDVGSELGGSLDIQRSDITGKVEVFGQVNKIARSWIHGGIIVDDTNNAIAVSISDNLITQSKGAGILVTMFGPAGFPDDVNGSITGNTIVRSAGAGINIVGEVRDIGSLEIRGNQLVANGGDGIHLLGNYAEFAAPAPGGPITLSDNVALGNHGRGYNLLWTAGNPTGIVDGGGNLAILNGLRPQMKGLPTKPAA